MSYCKPIWFGYKRLGVTMLKEKKKRGDIAKDKLYTIAQVFLCPIPDCELQGHSIQLFFQLS